MKILGELDDTITEYLSESEITIEGANENGEVKIGNSFLCTLIKLLHSQNRNINVIFICFLGLTGRNDESNQCNCASHAFFFDLA
jgi:hypothetical protein